MTDKLFWLIFGNPKGFSIFTSMEKSRIYIGEEIKKVMSERHITKAELARRLGIRPQSVDYLLTRKSVDTDTLYNVSKALDYDFAMLYSIRSNQINWDGSHKPHISLAKVLVEVELNSEDIEALNLKKRVAEALK